jgi:hypothetical protein
VRRGRSIRASFTSAALPCSGRMRRSAWVWHVLCFRETSLIGLAADEAVRILEENACSAEDVNPAALEGAVFDFCAAPPKVTLHL